MDRANFYKIKWGEIYYCNLGKMKGSVQCGRRPVMVVQTNHLNKHSPTVLVAIITTVKKKEDVDNHIILDTPARDTPVPHRSSPDRDTL